MNINNVFAGILGFIMALAMTYMTWDAMSSFIDGIGTVEIQLFLKVAYVSFVFILCVIVPINLASSDDTGQS